MMTMFTKKHLAVLMLAAGGLASGSAFAAPVACPNEVVFGNVTTSTTTLGFLTGLAEGCIQQDKIYSGWSSTGGLPTGAPIAISTTTDVPAVGKDTHTVSLNQAISNASGNPVATYTLSYTITVAIPPASTNAYITDVSIGSNVPGGTTGITVAKALTPGGTITSTNGSGASTTVFTQTIAVTDTITLNPGSQINSLSNTFVENLNAVPEPASLALMGLGLAGLGVWRRRKA